MSAPLRWWDECPDCGVAVGEAHIRHCDVPRCRICGGQRFSCELDGIHRTAVPVRWTGQWPGDVECQEWGWFSKFVSDPSDPDGPRGEWVECDADDPDAGPDLDRLALEGARGNLKWDGERWWKKV